MPTPSNDRLARFLDSPLLARVVPHLPPETLHELIRHSGLEACGELVTAATPAQLTSVLDLDLWRHTQPGRDDEFDADRFGQWLEVLVETGESVAARTIAALDPQLVIVGLSRYLRVFDPGTFEPSASSDDEPIAPDDLMSSETKRDGLERVVGGYLVMARRPDTWDAILSLLATLQAEQNAAFHAVMQGCRRLSNSTPEADGLDNLLLAPEQSLHDIAGEREDRRSRQGYSTPADARAFLELARKPQRGKNPIAAAYFRAVDNGPETSPPNSPAVVPEHAAADDIPTTVAAVMELLTEAGVMPERPLALLAATSEDPRPASIMLLRRLMAYVLHQDERAYLARSRELAFLANTLLAGSSVQSRPFTPQEAADAAACICNLGLECWPATRGAPVPPDAFLADHDLVAAFEAGWSALYRDVSIYVTDQLISTLAGLHSEDADLRRGLGALRRTLVKQRKAGTPWLARDAAEVLAQLDMTAWVSILGLLDECPILPATLTAILERRTTSVSPTEFDFISTTAQIGDIRIFVGMLPAVLAG